MEIFKKVKKTEICKTLEKTLCDKCNCEIKGYNSHDAFECYIELKTGTAYPEGGSGENKTIDLCPKCADELFKMLKEKGYRINESEWDF